RALEPQRGGRRDRTGTHRTYRSHRPDRTYESHGSVESRSAAGRDAGAGDARAGWLLADARRLVRVEAAAGLARHHDPLAVTRRERPPSLSRRASFEPPLRRRCLTHPPRTRTIGPAPDGLGEPTIAPAEDGARGEWPMRVVAWLVLLLTVCGASPAWPQTAAGPFGEVAHHVVRIDGLRVHYGDRGLGEPVVLIPGWPEMSWIAWRKVIPLLVEAGREVYVLEPRGFGDSDKPQ